MATGLALLMYRLPPQQQITMFRIFPMLGYYIIGKSTRGTLMFLALYPVCVAVSSTIDTLANDLHWNPFVATVIGLMMYWSFNYGILWDVNRVARKVQD
jgi:hypothetical protein